MVENNKDNEALDKTTTSFNIGGCPVMVYEQFIKFCEDNSTVTKVFYKENKREIKRDVWYAGGLKMLLDMASADAKNQMMFDKLRDMELKIKKFGEELNALNKK